MERHLELRTIIPRVIGAAQVRDISIQPLQRWFESISVIIAEYSIRPETMYDMDESGVTGMIEVSKPLLTNIFASIIKLG